MSENVTNQFVEDDDVLIQDLDEDPKQGVTGQMGRWIRLIGTLLYWLCTCLWVWRIIYFLQPKEFTLIQWKIEAHHTFGAVYISVMILVIGLILSLSWWRLLAIPFVGGVIYALWPLRADLTRDWSRLDFSAMNVYYMIDICVIMTFASILLYGFVMERINTNKNNGK